MACVWERCLAEMWQAKEVVRGWWCRVRSVRKCREQSLMNKSKWPRGLDKPIGGLLCSERRRWRVGRRAEMTRSSRGDHSRTVNPRVVFAAVKRRSGVLRTERAVQGAAVPAHREEVPAPCRGPRGHLFGRSAEPGGARWKALMDRSESHRRAASAGGSD